MHVRQIAILWHFNTYNFNASAHVFYFINGVQFTVYLYDSTSGNVDLGLQKHEIFSRCTRLCR